MARKSGPAPKPTAIKQLEGNPGRRKLNKKEPKIESGVPVCPSWLLPEAKKEWKRLAQKLHLIGVLTINDRAAFAGYCQSYAKWKEAQEHIIEEGHVYTTETGFQRPNPWIAISDTNQKLMLQFGSEFGLTPSSRSRLVAGTDVHDVNDDMDELLRGS